MIKKALSLAVCEQGLLSIFNMAVGLLLVRAMTREEFGVYAVVFALCLTLTTAQGSLVGVLNVLRPLVQSAEDERQLMTACSTAWAFLVTAAMLGTAIGMALIWRERPLLAATSALYVGGTLLREYVRTYLFSGLQIGKVIVGNVIYIAFSAAALGLTSGGMGITLDTDWVFTSLGLAAALSSVPALAACPADFRISLNSETRNGIARMWKKYSRWTVLGAVLSEIQERAYVFVVAGVFGTAAVGTLQAGVLLFRPVSMLFVGWRRIASTYFARLYRSRDLNAAHQFAHRSAVASVAINASLLVAIWIAWPFIDVHVFRGSYPGIETVVTLWGLQSATACLRDIYSTELTGFAKFRKSSISGIVGVLVLLLCLPVSLVTDNYRMIILANVPAYLCQLGTIIVMLRAASVSAGSPLSCETGRVVAMGQG